jgi:hypothetical protein
MVFRGLEGSGVQGFHTIGKTRHSCTVPKFYVNLPIALIQIRTPYNSLIMSLLFTFFMLITKSQRSFQVEKRLLQPPPFFC